MKNIFIILCVVIMFFAIVGCPRSDDQSNTLGKTSFTSSSKSDGNTTSSLSGGTNDLTHDGTITESVGSGGNNGGSHVPEPATLILLGAGLVVLAGVGRKKFFNKD